MFISIVCFFLLYSQNGYTPLHRACNYNSKEAIELLLQANADVNSKNNVSDIFLLFSICLFVFFLFY